MSEGKQAEFIQALQTGSKYIVVEAPAGTGKTYSCIQAVNALCESNHLKSYQKVLILTFSRNARAQLLKELASFPLDHKIYKHIDINNYHSFFKKYLDTYRDTIGITQKLRIVDEEDFAVALQKHASEQGLSLKILDPTILDDFLYENGKLTLINQSRKVKKYGKAEIALFIETAFSFTQATGVVCFSQFGNLVHKVLTRLPDMAAAISHDYPYIILDEYQDTNYFQEFFVKCVLTNSCGIFFCDRYQMIYAFRGSTASRVDTLTVDYPGIVKLEFDEYYRYKDKEDLVQLLTSIRQGVKPDYTKLINGELIAADVNCSKSWRNISNTRSGKSQCTIYCNTIMYKILRKITSALKCNKSVAILCRNNVEVEKFVELFFSKNLHPKEIGGTEDLATLGKKIKRLTSAKPISEKIPDILSLILLCSSKKLLFGENIQTIEALSYASFKRKSKPGYKLIQPIVAEYIDKCDYASAITLVNTMIDELAQKGELFNSTKRNFVSFCTRITNPSEEEIDGIILQRQYINSFSSIVPGLYITTVHQSKGKEFDYVFVPDIDTLSSEPNLLYVSHSRMKEKLFPIKVTYKGTMY